MHQSTQRRFCRFLFIAGCMLPTLAVVAWAGYEKLPSTTAARLDAVSRMLGVRVEAESLVSPTPGCLRLHQVTIADIETGQRLLAAERLDIDQAGPTAKLNVRGLGIDSRQLTQVARCGHRLLTVDWPGGFSVEASDLSWLDDATDAEQQLLAGRTLTAQLAELGDAANPSGRQWETKLTNPKSQDEVLRLTATRNRQVSPPATRIALDATGMAVPTTLVAELAPMLPSCGQAATFAGTATATFSHGVLAAGQGTVTGNLQVVSLAEFSQLPIDAVAEVTELELRWSGGRVAVAQGTLRTGAGRTSPALLAAVRESLYGESSNASQPREGEAAIAFGRLGMQFHLSGEGLSLWGTCPTSDAAAAALLLDPQHQVLLGRPQYRLPVAMLGEAVLQHGGEQATSATACLPVPVRRR